MTPEQIRSTLRTNLDTVENRLRSALDRCGRRRDEITLVAVTKTVAVDVAALLPELGVCDLGESRPQELWRKAAAIPSVRWHLVGHLQRNKAAATLPIASLIHSGDSERLLRTLDEEADRTRLSPRVLLEFNVSREPNKSGFAPEEADSLVELLRQLRHLQIMGLMGMAALEEDPERTRPAFAHLRQLRDSLREQLEELHPLCELSMGMSHDFEVAVEEGATLVRIGTALFEGVD